MTPPPPVDIGADAAGLLEAIDELAVLLWTERDVLVRALALVVRKRAAFERLRSIARTEADHQPR